MDLIAEDPLRRKLFKSNPNLIEGIPIILCVRDDIYQRFWCPFCVRTHKHGADKSPFMPRHRLAHCRSEAGKNAFPKGYYVFYEK